METLCFVCLVLYMFDHLDNLLMMRLTYEAPEGVGGDEPLAVPVIHPEGVLELLLHGVHVGVLHQEGGAQLAELPELNLS